MAQGVSTARLARELGCHRAQLLYLRRRLHRLARALGAEISPAGENGSGGFLPARAG
jgi:hypothetical protein